VATVATFIWPCCKKGESLSRRGQREREERGRKERVRTSNVGESSGILTRDEKLFKFKTRQI